MKKLLFPCTLLLIACPPQQALPPDEAVYTWSRAIGTIKEDRVVVALADRETNGVDRYVAFGETSAADVTGVDRDVFALRTDALGEITPDTTVIIGRRPLSLTTDGAFAYPMGEEKPCLVATPDEGLFAVARAPRTAFGQKIAVAAISGDGAVRWSRILGDRDDVLYQAVDCSLDPQGALRVFASATSGPHAVSLEVFTLGQQGDAIPSGRFTLAVPSQFFPVAILDQPSGAHLVVANRVDEDDLYHAVILPMSEAYNLQTPLDALASLPFAAYGVARTNDGFWVYGATLLTGSERKARAQRFDIEGHADGPPFALDDEGSEIRVVREVDGEVVLAGARNGHAWVHRNGQASADAQDPNDGAGHVDDLLRLSDGRWVIGGKASATHHFVSVAPTPLAFATTTDRMAYHATSPRDALALLGDADFALLATNTDVFIERLAPNGGFRWLIESSSASDETLVGAATLPGADFVLAGNSQATSGERIPWLWRIDGEFEVLWSREYEPHDPFVAVASNDETVAAATAQAVLLVDANDGSPRRVLHFDAAEHVSSVAPHSLGFAVATNFRALVIDEIGAVRLESSGEATLIAAANDGTLFVTSHPYGCETRTCQTVVERRGDTPTKWLFDGRARALQVRDDNVVFVAGERAQGDGERLLVGRFAEDGATGMLYGSELGHTRAESIALAADGGVLVAGGTDAVSGGPDGWLTKLDRAISAPSCAGGAFAVSRPPPWEPAVISPPLLQTANAQTSHYRVARNRGAPFEQSLACFSERSRDVGLALSVTGDGEGVLTTSVSGLSCPPVCDGSVPRDRIVTMTASPAPGSRFVGYADDCSGSAETTTLTMNGPKRCAAQFARNMQTLSLSVFGAGEVTTSLPGISACRDACSASFAEAAQFLVVASPDPSFATAFWRGDCTPSGTDVAAVTLSQDSHCDVVFAEAGMGAIAVEVQGQGTVTAPGFSCSDRCVLTLPVGETANLTVQADSDDELLGVSIDGAPLVTTNPLTVSAGSLARVVFKEKPKLRIRVEGSGSVQSNPTGFTCATDCEQRFPTGSVIDFVATPNPGFIFAGWASCALPLTLTQDTTCTARFELAPADLSHCRFGYAHERTFAGTTTTFTLADLDQNGSADLIAGAGALVTVRDLQNTSGTIATVAVSAPIVDLASADFDDDHDLDLAAAVSVIDGGSVYFFRNQSGVLTFQTSASAPNAADHLAAGDFNGDHVVELVTCSANAGPINRFVATAPFSFMRDEARVSGGAAMAIMSCSGIEHAGDTAFAASSSSGVTRFEPDVDGYAHAALETALANGELFASGDLDGVLGLDLLIAGGGSLHALRDNGSSYDDTTTGGLGAKRSAGQVDEDNRLDVVSATQTGATLAISLFHNTAAGWTIERLGLPYPAGTTLVGIGLGDVNGDGASDLIAVGNGGTTRVRVYLNRGAQSDATDADGNGRSDACGN